MLEVSALPSPSLAATGLVLASVPPAPAQGNAENADFSILLAGAAVAAAETKPEASAPEIDPKGTGEPTVAAAAQQAQTGKGGSTGKPNGKMLPPGKLPRNDIPAHESDPQDAVQPDKPAAARVDTLADTPAERSETRADQPQEDAFAAASQDAIGPRSMSAEAAALLPPGQSARVEPAANKDCAAQDLAAQSLALGAAPLTAPADRPVSQVLLQNQATVLPSVPAQPSIPAEAAAPLLPGQSERVSPAATNARAPQDPTLQAAMVRAQADRPVSEALPQVQSTVLPTATVRSESPAASSPQAIDTAEQLAPAAQTGQNASAAATAPARHAAAARPDRVAPAEPASSMRVASAPSMSHAVSVPTEATQQAAVTSTSPLAPIVLTPAALVMGEEVGIAPSAQPITASVSAMVAPTRIVAGERPAAPADAAYVAQAAQGSAPVAARAPATAAAPVAIRDGAEVEPAPAPLAATVLAEAAPATLAAAISQATQVSVAPDPVPSPVMTGRVAEESAAPAVQASAATPVLATDAAPVRQASLAPASEPVTVEGAAPPANSGPRPLVAGKLEAPVLASSMPLPNNAAPPVTMPDAQPNALTSALDSASPLSTRSPAAEIFAAPRAAEPSAQRAAVATGPLEHKPAAHAAAPTEALLPANAVQPDFSVAPLSNEARPMLASALTSASQAMPTPPTHDLAALVDRITEARAAAAPQVVRATLAHADFGAVSLNLRPQDTHIHVTLGSADPGFAPAVHAAAAAASLAVSEHSPREPQGAPPQDTQAQNHAATQQQPSHQHGARDRAAAGERAPVREPAQGRSGAAAGAQANDRSQPQRRGGIYA